MIRTLYKRNIRSHYKLVIAALALFTMYMLVILNMYDKGNADLMQGLASIKMSKELMAAFGFTAPPPGLTGFIAGYLYGFLLLALPLVTLLVIANRLVASLVDQGSMAAILSTPHTRRSVAATQALFLLSVLVLQVVWVTALGFIVSGINHPGQLDHAAFLRLNLGLLLTHLAVSGIAFFASCLFSDTRWSLTVGSGLPVFFLIVQLLINASPGDTWLRYLTLFSLFPADELTGGGVVWPRLLLLLLIGAGLYTGGIWVFDRKDLPL